MRREFKEFDYLLQLPDRDCLPFCILSDCTIGLLAVSSKDDDPINKFVDLFNSDQLPPLFNDGAMDPNILKHFVLVHDNQDGTAER